MNQGSIIARRGTLVSPIAHASSIMSYQANPAVTAPVPSSPVLDANSAAIISTLVGSSNPLALELIAYSEPLFYVHGNSTPKFNVTTFAGYSGPCGITQAPVPIPSGFFGANGSDGQATIVDLDSLLAYCASVWSHNASTGAWSCFWGGVYPLKNDGLYGGGLTQGLSPDLSGSSSSPYSGTWPGKPSNWTQPAYANYQTGSHMSRFGMIITQADLAAALVNPVTAIRHAMFFASTNTASTFRFPAGATDGPQGSGTQIPEGARIYLPTSFNIATQMSGASKGALAIAYGLQNYGAYCGDSGGSRIGMACEFAGTYASGNNSGVNSMTNTVFGGGVGDFWNVPELYSSGAWAAMHVLNSWNGT